MATNSASYDHNAHIQQPPVYKYGGSHSGLRNKKLNYQVPEFYGFEHTSTKWMLATLSTRTGLQRLSLLANEQPHVLSAYYQIPDRPLAIYKRLGTNQNEQPAYNNLAILYVTPLALAIYCKQLEAVRNLLRYKDHTGAPHVHPNAPCFVQKLFKKGDFKMSNDLSNTYPVIIAIRRGFCDAIPLLMHAGYAPQQEFSIIYRRAFREVVTYYRDIVDYLVDLLRTKPGNHVYVLMHAITSTICPTSYDLFTFDVEENKQEEGGGEQWVSIFRRIARLGVNSRYYNEESGMALITILEYIQKAGFFRTLLLSSNSRFDNNSPEIINSSNNTAIQLSPIKKISRRQIIKSEGRNSQLEFDRNTCVGILVYWYQIVVIKRRSVQKDRVELMLARVLIDTGLIQHFFTGDDESLAELFSTWSEGASIRAETIACLKSYLPEKINSVSQLAQQFLTRYNGDPDQFIGSTNNSHSTGYVDAFNNRGTRSINIDVSGSFSHNTKNNNSKWSAVSKLPEEDHTKTDADISVFTEQFNQSASFRTKSINKTDFVNNCNLSKDTTEPVIVDETKKRISKNDNTVSNTRPVSVASHSKNSKRRGVRYLNIKHSKPESRKSNTHNHSPTIFDRNNASIDQPKSALSIGGNNFIFNEGISMGNINPVNWKIQNEKFEDKSEEDHSSGRSTSIMTNLMTCLESNLKKSDKHAGSVRRRKDLKWITGLM